MAAFSANRALSTGTTSCGPAVVVISSSTPDGGDGEVVGFGQQVTDLGEELAVRLGVERLDHALPVPLVDLGLQLVAAAQQILVLRGEVGDDLVDARPEAVRVDVGAGQGLVVHEVVEHPGDAQVPHRHAISHVSPPHMGLIGPHSAPTGPN